MDEFAELIRREFEEIASEEEKELENMELGLSDVEFQVIKARALNGVIERIRLHQQNGRSRKTKRAAIYSSLFSLILVSSLLSPDVIFLLEHSFSVQIQQQVPYQ